MRVLAATFAFNEGEKIQRTLARHPAGRDYDLLVVDDGSTDGAVNGVDRSIAVIRNDTRRRLRQHAALPRCSVRGTCIRWRPR